MFKLQGRCTVKLTRHQMDLAFAFNLLLLMSLPDCTNAHSDLVLRPSSPLVTEFNPLTLYCKYFGNKTVDIIFWRTNDIKLAVLRSDCHNSYITPNPYLYDYSCPSTNEATWTIKNITTANHHDQWYCDIATEHAIFASKSVTISVRVAVQRVNLTGSNEDVISVQEGNVVELHCKTSLARPSPDITWYKDEGTLDYHDDLQLIDNDTYQYSKYINDLYSTFSTLMYTPTRFDNGMRIYCVANNTYETTVMSVKKPRLNVEYDPVNINFNSSTDVFYRDEQTRCDAVLCSTDCNPSCEVTWYRLGEISPVSSNSVFNLGLLSRDDNGTYVCKVTKVGTNIELTKLLIIIVSHKPDSPSDLKFLSCYDIPTFSWKSGNNGGQSQTFILQTSRTESNSWINQTKVKENDDQCFNVSGMYVAILSKILPGQYVVRVIAENRIGQSEPMFMQQAISIVGNQAAKQEAVLTVSDSSRQNKSDNTTLILGLTLGVLVAAFITYVIYMTATVKRLKSETGRVTDARTSVRNCDVQSERHLHINDSGEVSGRRGKTIMTAL